MSKPENVDAYIAAADSKSHAIMEEIRAIIFATIPDAEEGIGWNVPIYKYHGILAGFDATKKHVSFGVDVLRDEDRERLEEEGYKTGKKTIQIKFDQKVPVEVIRKILIDQARLNEIQNMK